MKDAIAHLLAYLTDSDWVLTSFVENGVEIERRVLIRKPYVRVDKNGTITTY